MFPSFRFVAAARINSSVGAASFRWQTGGFASVSNAVAGTFVLTLRDDYAVDATEIFPIIEPDSALAASTLVTFGFANTSDTVKTITVVKEDAAGAESILANVDFFVALLRRPIR